MFSSLLIERNFRISAQIMKERLNAMPQDVRFEKSPTCPDNEQLLAYQRQALSPAEAGDVATHLQDCEFCLLLLDLLASHPESAPLPPDPPPVPDGLRQLFSRRREVE